MRIETFYKFVLPKYKNSDNFFYKIINGLTLLEYHCINSICDRYVRKYYPKCLKKLNEEQREKKIIISFTTIPSRIENIPYVMRSIFNQTMMPDKVILWISDKVDDRNYILDMLRDEIENGLDVRFIKDVRVHTKYYYAMKEFPNDIIITIDDDIIYSEYLIERLFRKYLNNKECVIASRVHEVVCQGYEILPYKYWNRLAPGKVMASHSLLATGVGGVLYPPNSLYKDWINTELFLELCPAADDIWLKIMESLNGTKVLKLNKYSKEVFVFGNTQEVALSKVNVNEGRNDILLKKCKTYYGFNANLFK